MCWTSDLVEGGVAVGAVIGVLAARLTALQLSVHFLLSQLVLLKFVDQRFYNPHHCGLQCPNHLMVPVQRGSTLVN